MSIRLSCFLLLLLCLLPFVFGLTGEVSDSVWSSTIIIEGEVKVVGNVTVAPGTTIYLVDSASSLTVLGSLKAEGTQDQKILFATNTTTISRYNYLECTTSSNCIFSHCIFEKLLAVRANNRQLNVSFCEYRFNSFAFVIGGNFANVRDSKIYNNTEGIYITSGFPISINIENCVASFNTEYGLKSLGGVSIYNSTFNNNQGDGIQLMGLSAVIMYSTIRDNRANGVQLNGVRTLTFQYNNVYGNNVRALNSNFFSSYNVSFNYFGTTNLTQLRYLLPDYFDDSELGRIAYPVLFSQPYPCSDCTIYIDEKIPAGYYSVDTTIPVSDYTLSSSLVVMKGVTVTFIMGSTFHFLPGSSLIVDGAVTFQDNGDGATTKFTSANSTTWGMFYFKNTQEATTIKNVVFERMSQMIILSTVSFEKCTFQYNANAISARGTSKITVYDSTFYQNVLVAMTMLSTNVNITSCDIKENRDVFLLRSHSFFSVTKSTIHGNSNYPLNIQIFERKAQTIVEFNKIYENRPGAVYIAPSYLGNSVYFQNVTINYNDIYDNTRGNGKVVFFATAYGEITGDLNIKYNYFGPTSQTDLCFFGDAMNTHIAGKNINYNPVLSSSFDSQVCPGTNCPVQTITPVLRIYDSCGVCGGDGSTCPSYCQAAAGTPYQCSDGSCVAKPTTCLKSFCNTEGLQSYMQNKTVTCWNGDCVAAAALCPPLGRCVGDKPKRCLDATCIPADESCPADAVCPYPFISCPDGSCASACLPFNGCPVSSPVICPSGLCTADYLECVRGCKNGEYQCYDGKCRATCPRPPWFENILATSSFITDSFTVTSVSAESTMTINLSQKRKRSDPLKMNFVTVADSNLRRVDSSWKNGLGFEQNLASMVIDITMDQPLQEEVELEFTNLDIAKIEDYFCLGFINETTNKWQCQSAIKPHATKANTFVGTTNHFTSFAVMLEVNKDRPEREEEEETPTTTSNNSNHRGGEKIDNNVIIGVVVGVVGVAIMAGVLFVFRDKIRNTLYKRKANQLHQTESEGEMINNTTRV